MNIPEIKKFFGYRIRAKKLTRTTLYHALVSLDTNKCSVLIPKNDGNYLAFVNDKENKIKLILVNERKVTEKDLESLAKDITKSKEKEEAA